MSWCGRGVRAVVLFVSCTVAMGCGRDDVPVDGADMRSPTPTLDMSIEPDARAEVEPDLGVDMMVDEPDLSGDEPDMRAELDMALEPVISTEVSAEGAYALVDPFIGSGGAGFGYAALTPAAQAPLGLVKLGPDTTRGTMRADIQHMSGYNYSDPHTRGFSHLHFVGTGVADYGNLRVFPSRSTEGVNTVGWYTSLDKSSEQARPGWYAATLDELDVQVELAATPHVGLHRYTFGDATDGPVYLNIDGAASVRDSGIQAVKIESVDGAKVTGWLTYQGGYVGRRHPFTLYFVATVEPAPDSVSVWDADGIKQGESSAESTSAGMILGWDDAPEGPVELRFGLSVVDGAGAEANLNAEAPAQESFEAVTEGTRQRWLDKLGRVRVTGGTAREREIFYTAFYNAYRMPTQFSDVDGRYRGLDTEIGQMPDGHTYYTDLSLWDSFRTTHPWYMLVDEDVQRDCLLSLMRMYDAGGAIPRWPAALSYTGGMIGTSADHLFGGAAAKGLTGVDWSTALDAVLVTADGRPEEGALFSGRGAIEEYLMYGYVPAGADNETVSRTLEFAYNDASVAYLARAAGRDDVAARFDMRAMNYVNVWDPGVRFFRERATDGTWTEPFEETKHGDRGGMYTEGSAWNWRFYVPHDGAGLAELFGGPEKLGEELETFFTESKFGESILGQNFIPDVYYWHGNQPAIHSAFFFAYSDRPERAAYWLDQIRGRLYTDGPDGLPGNDDGGTLSSWYLFSAIGLYPIAGSDRYILGAPIFERVEIDMSSGTLVVTAPGAGPGKRDVSAVTAGGDEVSGPEITHETLRGGGVDFELR